MFDAISAASEEMAGPTVFTGRTADALGDLVPVRWMIGLFVTLEYFRFFDRVARPGGKLFIGSGLFVTDQTIDLGLIRKVKILVFPTVSRMT